MYRNVFTPDYKVASRSLLFLGFDQSFDNNIRHFPYGDSEYEYKIENDSNQALKWLESKVEQVETFQLPFAVFCHLDWLVANQFHISRHISRHPFLKFVPIIALSDHDVTEAFRTLITNNRVDDCYTVPVDWAKLEARLDFLNQYKPELLEKEPQLTRESYEMKLSPGKRLFDIIGALSGILLSSWIWLPTMLAIRLESKGPIIYKSKRIGRGYKVIDFLKFRSMYVDADQHLQHLHHLNQYSSQGEQTSVFVKISRDPRTTRVGRFIRKYSIDELPQLLNVLRGDMSLVGNRPLPLYEAEMLTKDEWAGRFLAPAGITGLWQVNKRRSPKMSAEDRIMLDVQYYQNHPTVMNDFMIALKTLVAFVQRDDA
jgi:lipopolysaccharide/colanic/teichoic acid biosynthesis glycosyltransferase